MRAEVAMSDPAYTVGYNFVAKVVKAMVEAGEHENKALLALIKKPPQVVDDLAKPREYVMKDTV